MILSWRVTLELMSRRISNLMKTLENSTTVLRKLLGQEGAIFRVVKNRDFRLPGL